MRHLVKSKRVNRNASHLDLMLRNLATSIILYEKIKTTKPKAKQLKAIIEKLIVDVKDKPTVNVYRLLNSYLLDKNASNKMVHELTNRYKDRNAGFVRITNLGHRAGDAAPMVQIELV